MKHWIVTMAITSALVIAPLAYAEKQPHMEHALKDLQNAKKQLEEADHDKGGHRVKAIDLINQAISQVKEGIEYDNTHPEKKK
jgi:hypothetical protein